MLPDGKLNARRTFLATPLPVHTLVLQLNFDAIFDPGVPSLGSARERGLRLVCRAFQM